MKRRRFLYTVGGLTLGLLFPGHLVRASEQGTAKEAGGLFVPTVEEPAVTAANVIYLTFDDGYVGLAEKVAALNALGVPGTFFLVGQAIYNNARTVQWLVNSGHVLANHTYSHPLLTRLSYNGIVAELQGCERAARATAGVSTLPFMRPPGGAVNATVRSAAASLGYQTILWNWDTWDWAGRSAASIGQNIRPGIVLMHTQGRNTVAALSNVVPVLAERGYVFGVL